MTCCITELGVSTPVTCAIERPSRQVTRKLCASLKDGRPSGSSLYEVRAISRRLSTTSVLESQSGSFGSLLWCTWSDCMCPSQQQCQASVPTGRINGELPVLDRRLTVIVVIGDLATHRKMGGTRSQSVQEYPISWGGSRVLVGRKLEPSQLLRMSRFDSGVRPQVGIQSHLSFL